MDSILPPQTISNHLVQYVVEFFDLDFETPFGYQHPDWIVIRVSFFYDLLQSNDLFNVRLCDGRGTEDEL